MCGRYAFFASADKVAERFQVPESTLLEPRYNIAPTQAVLAVRSTSSKRELVRPRWGLIPSWSKDKPSRTNPSTPGRKPLVKSRRSAPPSNRHVA